MGLVEKYNLPDKYVGVGFFFKDTATTDIYTLSLHDALPISQSSGQSSSTTMPSGVNAIHGIIGWRNDSGSNTPPIHRPDGMTLHPFCRAHHRRMAGSNRFPRRKNGSSPSYLEMPRIFSSTNDRGSARQF